MGTQAERAFYPGLSYPRERAVLRAWFKLYESRFENYLYNLRLGKGRDPGDGFPPEARRDAVMNSQSRVDVVAWSGGRVTLIEVKERALARQVGQLVSYEILWRELAQRQGVPDEHKNLGISGDFPANLPWDVSPSLLLVTARIDDDAMRVFQKVGAAVDVVVPDANDPDWSGPRK